MRSNKKGFTLVEILLVIVLIAIIAIITLPNIMNALKSSKNQGGKAIEELLTKNLELYNETNKDDLWTNRKATNICIPISFDDLKAMNQDINLGECKLYKKNDAYQPLVIKKLSNSKYEYYANIICGRNLGNSDTFTGTYNENDISYVSNKEYKCDGIWQSDVEASTFEVSLVLYDNDAGKKTVKAYDNASFDDLELSTDKESVISCDNNQTGTISGDKVIVNTVTANTTCVVSLASDIKCPSNIDGPVVTYDGNNHGITVSNDAVGSVEYSTDSAIWSSTTPTFSNAGNHIVEVRVKNDAGFTKKCTNGNVGVVINKRDITIKADDKNITYGETVPSFTYTVSGAIGNEVAISGDIQFTVSNSSSAVISNLNNLAAGSYQIKPSNLEATSNYNIKEYQSGVLRVDKITCPAPTNLSVSTGGIVTWSPSGNNNCDKYKISIDNINWTENVSSGLDLLSKLIADSNNKTVYLKAYGSDSNYLESNSATKSVVINTVEFMSNNNSMGSVSPTNAKVISGSTISTSGNDLVIKGVTTGSSTKNIVSVEATPKAEHIFSNWNPNSGTIDSDKNIVANFTPIAKYEVKYDANGGTGDLFTDNDAVNPWIYSDGVWKSGNYHVDSSTSTISTKEFTLTSTDTLSFDWAASAEGIGYDYLNYTIYKDGSVLNGTGASTQISGDKTLTSESQLSYTRVTKELSPGTYKVSFSFYKDSGQGKGLDRGYVKNLSLENTNLTVMPNTLHTLGVAKNLAKNIYTKQHYSFKGWATSSSATTPTYTDEESVTDLSTTNDDVVTLYAVWAPVDYTVDVVINEGSVDTSSKQVTYNQSTTFTVTPNTPGRGSVTCTNGQEASISGSTLTVSNVSSDTVCTVSFSTVVTTVFADGTLIINEKLMDRDDNVASHGDVIDEYDPLSDKNAYVFKNPNFPYWHEHNNDISTVLIGSEIKPVSTSYWFFELFPMSSGTFTNLDTSDVTDMTYMFSSAGEIASSFTLTGLNDWNVSSVIFMNNMFSNAGKNASTVNIGNISAWNTSNVTDMTSMFAGYGFNATSFNLSIGSWDVSNVQTMNSMFHAAGYNTTGTWTVGNLSNWQTSSLNELDQMFYQSGYNANSWSIGDISNWDVSNVVSMRSFMFSAGYRSNNWNIGLLKNWNVSHVTDMQDSFHEAGYNASVFKLDLSNWNVSNVTNMMGLFRGSGFNSSTWNIGDISSWNLENATNLSAMFREAGHNSTTWNSIGSLDIYSSDVNTMFQDTSNAKAHLTIHNQPTNYEKIFTGAATKTGSLITLDFKCEHTFIDDMIATKSSNSNVQKRNAYECNGHNFNVTYYSGNLLVGLPETSEKVDAGNRLRYSIDANGVITATGLVDDGYGYVGANVTLTAGKTYVFSATSTGAWPSKTEAFLTGPSVIRMAGNNNYEFSPTVSGTYDFRIDVNVSGETHTLSNIDIYEKVDTQTKTYGSPYGTLPSVTRDNYSLDGWYTAKKGGAKITATSNVSIAENHSLYARWNENGKYNVSLNVNNGRSDSTIKTVYSGSDAVFNLTPNYADGYSSINVSCTNGQSGTTSGLKLTVGNVSNNTDCTATFVLKTFSITYGNGSDSTASKLPATQTKEYGKTLYISDTIPISSTNTYIGWNTIPNATSTTGTWYQEGASYSTNANLSLQAQWYNVGSLEDWYYKIIRVGSGEEFDFVQATSSVDERLVDAGTAYTMETKYVRGSNPGFSSIEVSGFATAGWLRPVWMGGFDQFVVYAQQDIKTEDKKPQAYKRFRLIRDRDSNRPVATDINDRINALQQIQDVGLTYDDIQTKEYTNSVNLASDKGYSMINVTPDSGYKFIMASGYRVSGTNANKAFVYQHYCDESSGHISIAKSYSGVSPNVTLKSYFVEVKDKSSVTKRNFSSTSNGPARLNALQALEAAKNNYFPRDYVKSAYFQVQSLSIKSSGVSAWTKNGKDYTLSVPNGKILGPIAFDITNASTDGANRNRCYMTEHYVDDSGVFHQYAVAGNKDDSTSTGVDARVRLYSAVVYISPSTIQDITY